jgi:endoglucanase
MSAIVAEPTVRTDLHGNVIVVKPDSRAGMLAGHCDQIGLIVQHIDDEGSSTFSRSGVDPEVLIGQR